MPKFPVDAPKQKVVRALEKLGFQIVREKEHISMERMNPDGTKTPLTMSNHPKNQIVYPESHLHPSGNFARRIYRRLRQYIRLEVFQSPQIMLPIFEIIPLRHSGVDFYWQSRFGYTFHFLNFGQVRRVARFLSFLNCQIASNFCIDYRLP